MRPLWLIHKSGDACTAQYVPDHARAGISHVPSMALKAVAVVHIFSPCCGFNPTVAEVIIYISLILLYFSLACILLFDLR